MNKIIIFLSLYYVWKVLLQIWLNVVYLCLVLGQPVKDMQNNYRVNSYLHEGSKEKALKKIHINNKFE